MNIYDDIQKRTQGSVFIGVVGAVSTGKSTFINHILTSMSKMPTITTSAVPNTTASFITIKLNKNLTIVSAFGICFNIFFPH